MPEGFTLDQPEAEQAEPAAPEAPKRDMGDEVLRQGGLALRAVLEAPANLLAMPTDALFGLVNYVQAKRGQPMPFKLASESIHDAYGEVLPTAETPQERIATDVVGALSGPGSASLGAGQALTRAAGPAARAVGETLLTRPGLQVAGNVAGQGSASATREGGGGAAAQTAAGIVGGVVGGNAGAVAGGVRRGLSAAVVEPLAESGRRAIAGRVLNTAASNSERAAANLANDQPIVRGSMPTTGQVARDPGLAYFENRMRALDASKFAGRMSQQNEARQSMLDSIARSGEPDAVQSMITRRDSVTAPMRNKAFIEAQGKPVDNQKILSEIDGLLSYPDNAGESVQRALKAVRSQVEGKTDARELYAVRKEINRLLEGKFVGSDEHILRYAGSQLKNVREAIDDQISAVAPSWGQYLTKYAQLSRPIERAETMANIRGKVTLAAPDIETGREFLSQAKFKQTVQRNIPDLSKTMTKGQISKLLMVAQDLDRGAAAAGASNIRPPGSDTAANLATMGQLSVANIVARALATSPDKLPPALATLTRPLSFVYKLPDEAVKELLVDAMLDPKLANQLMKEGSIANVRAFSDSLSESLTATGMGATVGAAPESLKD